jgi:murein DD-endopeptidase MepM/ murein hydrolase activator NlpD
MRAAIVSAPWSLADASPVKRFQEQRMALSTGFRLPLGNGFSTEAYDGDGFYVGTNFNQYNPEFNAFHLAEDWNVEGDMLADLGIPLYAISNGTVVEKGVLDSFGNYLIIRHDLPAPITVNGITTSSVYSLYGHLQNPAVVSVGDVVGIGQQIGNVGYTGMADGNAHVHLEIRLGYGVGYENTNGYNPGGAAAGWVDPSDFINSHRTTMPLLTGTSPVDNALTAPVDVNIVLTFNETVVAGSGSILLYNANGTLARTIDVTDQSQVTFSGNTLTINPESDLAPGSGYYVNMAAGVVRDLAGNGFGGISGSGGLNFTTAGPDLAGNSLAAARAVTLGSGTTTLGDFVGATDADDYFKFTTNGATHLTANLTGLSGDADLYLLNSSGAEAHSYNFGVTPETIDVAILAAGTYYVRVHAYNNAATTYSLGLTAAPVGAPPDLAGNTLAAARAAMLGSATTTFTDFVGPADTKDFYKFTTTGATSFALSLTGLTADADVYLLNASGVDLAHSLNVSTTSEYINVANLAAGTYYVEVVPYSTFATNYSLAMSAAPVAAPPDLAGNTLATARAVTLSGTPTSYSDFAGPADTNDYYTFTTAGPTSFALSLTGLAADADVSLLNSAGTEIAHSNNSGSTAEAINVANLAAGTYYVQVHPYLSAATNYSLGLSAAPVAPPPPDLAGNTLATARAVTLGPTTSSYNDFVGPADTNDYYKFTTTAATHLALHLTGLTDDADVYLLNAGGTEVAHSYNFGSAPEAIDVASLAAGTYYVQVHAYGSAATNYMLDLTGMLA